MHIYLGEQITDTGALKTLVHKIANNYRLPYFTLTPTFSVCPSHGYLRGEKLTCPQCSQETEVYSRVVGYLRPLKQWNDGKQAEYQMRKTFNLPNPVQERPARITTAKAIAEVLPTVSQSDPEPVEQERTA